MTPDLTPTAQIRSMTGFARLRRDTPVGEITVSLRSVNHRGLDIHFHHGGEFAEFENTIRSQIKRYVQRGHVEVRLSLGRTTAPARLGFNRELLTQFLAAFEQVQMETGSGVPLDLNQALRLPGMFQSSSAGVESEPIPESDLAAIIEDCLAELNRCREQEGSQLAALIQADIAAIARQAQEMTDIRQQALSHFHQRLTDRLAELLKGAALDPKRLAEEAALLTDRSDVQEELTRLAIHNSELKQMVERGGEAGKRIDFLLQEMNRETNTVLSKTSGLGEVGLTMTGLALATKANIEKIKEQALNIE